MRVSMRLVARIAAFVLPLVLGCSTETPEQLLASGKQYLSRNDPKAAAIQLKNVLQKDPNSVEARFLLGQALLASGDIVSAEKELRRAMEMKYAPEKVVPPLARSMVLLGAYQKVVDEFATVQLTTPESKAELYTAVGNAHLALGNVGAGRDALAKAVAAQPNYVPAHLANARVIANSGDANQALALVNSALNIAPNDPESWFLKGDILHFQGQLEPAGAAYRKALEVRPDFLPAHYALVSSLIEQKKLDEASKQLNQMSTFAPGHHRTLYLKALLAYRKADFTGARAAIQQQLRAAPDNPEGLLLAGAIELELKAYAQAEAHLLKVLNAAADQSAARRILIAVYLRSGQPTKALDTLKPALATIEKDAAMLALAGETYMVNGQTTQAAAYFAKATALDPGDARKRTAGALSQIAKGDAERGFRELERVAAVDSGMRADLALIAAHMQRREHDAALAAIATLEKKDPKSPLPHNLRGGVLLDRNDRAGARQSFERALQVDPTYFLAAGNLATLDLADGKPDAARGRYEAVLAKDPNNLQALVAIAMLRHRTGGTIDQVAALLKKAISAHPQEPQPRLALIGFYVGKKEVKKAVGAAQEAMAAIPTDPDILDAAGRAHEAAGETNQALSIYAKLASLQPGLPYAYLRTSEVQVAAKRKEDALETLRKALNAKPDSLEIQRALIALLLDSGQVREALAISQEMQKQRPHNAIGYATEGDIHATRKNWNEAVKAYRAGLNRAGSPSLAIKLHRALRDSGSAAEAEQFSASWLKNYPTDTRFRMHVAEVAMRGKDYRTAVQHYRKLLETQPDDVVILNNLAWSEAQLKDPAALAHAERANELAPNQAVIMDTLGVLLFEKGETARGLEVLQKATALAPRSAAIRLNLAKALIKAGQKDAARKELDELTKLGDKFSGHAEVTQLKRSL